jgi:flavin reductase (DIM6/NTAB) family NADH-FMN oxidoreductase RutF
MNASAFSTEIFNLFDKRWALVTAGSPEHFNSMTISWGSLGTIWGAPQHGRPIVTVYINPLRYTYEFMNQFDFFTVCFFPEAFRKDLLTMGSLSGRSGNKLASTGLTPCQVGQTVGYKEAELTFVCCKLYAQTLDKSLIRGGIADRFYAPEEQAHCMYIGEVKEILTSCDPR